MKRFCIFTVVFLLAGAYSIAALDLIIMRDGNIIEAKVMEISPTEIRYKRSDHLDGPTIVISAANVLSIRYENGTSEIVTPVSGSMRERTQPVRPDNTAIDQNKFIFGVNANAGGALNYIWGGPSGASVNFEFGRGNFNSEINLSFPIGGFGFLATFNRFWHGRIGGFYLGGGLGYSFYNSRSRIEVPSPDYEQGSNTYYHGEETSKTKNHSLAIGLNIGYKFVTKSGVYFRTGIFTGFDFGYLWNWGFTLPAYIKPDLAIGWTMR